MHSFFTAALLAASLAASTVQAAPAQSNLAARVDTDRIGPYPLKLDDKYITIRDGTLVLTGDKTTKSDFVLTPAHANMYDTHGTIYGWMGLFTESFGFFSPADDLSQCVKGVSNTTRATHYTIEPCNWDRYSDAYGLQLFHVLSGAMLDQPPQDQNFVVDWIPFGTKGKTHPTDPNAYDGHKPMNGWRFYPRPSDGIRLQSQPKGNGVGTKLRFRNETIPEH